MNTRRVAVLAATIATTAALLTGCAAATTPVAASHQPTAAATSQAPKPSPPGSRQNPYATGTPGSYDPTLWTFTFLSTNGNAWPAVQTLDPMSNTTPPAAGMAYVLATVKMVAGQASNPDDPSSSSTIGYVGADGNTYPPGACGSLGPQDLRDASPMYAGATNTYLICSVVPTSAVTGGTWAVARNYVNSTTPTVFFQGAS